MAVFRDRAYMALNKVRRQHERVVHMQWTGVCIRRECHTFVPIFLDVERPVRVHLKGHHRAKDCGLRSITGF